MTWPYTMTYTPVAGDTILAAHIVTSNNEHINNNIPESIDDFSNDITEMGTVKDPYPASSESQPTILSEELKTLRYQILELAKRFASAPTKWYHDIGTSLFMAEKAAAESDLATYGQLWIKTATPNQLWFTDDAGTDFHIATLSNKLSNFTATSSAELLSILSDETGTGLAVFNDTPTIITPTVVSLTNMQHNHADAAGGGVLGNSAFSVNKNGTNQTGITTGTWTKVTFSTEAFDTK